jgi:hypothetical protein
MADHRLEAKHYEELERYADEDEQCVEAHLSAYFKHGPDVFSPSDQAFIREILRLSEQIEHLMSALG